MIRHKWDWVVVTAVLLNLTDMLMTIPHWGSETNPLLLQIGLEGMVITKILAAIGLCAVWWGWEGVDTSKIAKASVLSLTGFYGIVVVANTTVYV